MSKIIKKAAALLLAIFIFSSGIQEVFAESEGFANESMTAVYARTPYGKSDVSILWNTKEADTAGVPVSVGEFVLLPVLNKVNKLNDTDGSTAGSVSFDEKVSENCRGAVVNQTLIQPTRTCIYAVDIENMTVKCSKSFGTIVTDVAAVDNLVYFGTKQEKGYKFHCADLNSNLETVWEYESDEAVTSPALLNDIVMFGAGSRLVCRNEEGFAENTLPAVITSVFAGNYAVFMTANDGNVYKLRLESDGSAEKDSMLSCKIGGELSPPAEYENRLYISSTEGFFILDALNMDVEKSFSELKNPESSSESCAPLISYGSGTRAYIAVPHKDENGDRWYLYSILDSEEEITVSEIVKIIDFSNGEAVISKSGKMFFRDNLGQLWAIAVKETNIFVIILKLVLMAGIIVILVIIIMTWSKKRAAKRPPQY